MNRLHVIGLGIREAAQLTLEGLVALKKADKILLLPVTSGQVEEFLLKHRIGPYENLKNLYQEGQTDTRNYERLLEKVVAECQQHPDVALLVPGHPRIGVTLLQWLEQQKSELGIQLTVIEGVSSFDTIINDLKTDPLEKGSAILDANRILLFEYPLNPMLDHYIYHTCSIGSAEVNVDRPARNNRIDLLQNHLLRFYPQDHPVVLISSSVAVEIAVPETLSIRLDQLLVSLPFIHYGTTLFVPGIPPKKINRQFLTSIAPELS